MTISHNIQTITRNLFCFIPLFYLVISAQSFEGKMHGKLKNNTIDDLFIWVDLKMPKDSGKISGSYFYKTIGKSIAVYGNKNGKSIILNEMDKNKKTTGIFKLLDTNNILCGYWYKPDFKDSLMVELHITSPVFKETARLPKLSELLAEEIEFYSMGGDSYINYWIMFARCNLMSVQLSWENFNYTARYGTINRTYDLSSGQEINLSEGINDDGVKYFCSGIQEQVSEFRGNYSDSEWVEALNPHTMEYVEDLFTVESLQGVFFLRNDSLVCYIEDFCGQNYASGDRDMTFNCQFGVPIEELKKYITKESVLQNLYKR